MKKQINIEEELNEIDSMIDALNMCRMDYYKLYEKDFKVASIRLRKRLEYVIQTSKQMKREALKYRKEIEEREENAKKEARDAGYYQ